MKKASSVMIWTLFILMAFHPTGILAALCFGYGFKLMSVPVYAAAIAALSLCALVFDIISGNKAKNRTLRIIIALLTPMSLIGGLINVFACYEIAAVVSSLVSAVLCCCLTVRHGKNLGIKITASIFYSLLILFFCFMSFLAVVMGNFGESTVIKSVDSPDGKYYAQVVSIDQGALGGDTLVSVYKRSGIDLFLFKIEKRPQKLYFGEWGEYIQISWTDDKCLRINSVEYSIK